MRVLTSMRSKLVHSLEGMPEHSPLGASGASRWMKCPGSVSFGKGDFSESSSYAQIGSAAHAVLELCLRDKHDAWECIGEWYDIHAETLNRDRTFDDMIRIDKDIADGVQVMINAVHSAHPWANNNNSWVEHVF